MLSDAAFTSPLSAEVLISGKLPIFDENEDDFNMYSLSKRLTENDNDAMMNSASESYLTSSECSTEDLYDPDEDHYLFGSAFSTCINSDMDSGLPTGNTIWGGNKAPFPSEKDVEIGSGDLSKATILTTDLDSGILAVSDWSNIKIPEASKAFTCTTVSTSSTCSSCRSNRQEHGRNKRWSSMSRADQLKTVDHLSAVISTELGLREQLEVIKIISPSADVSSTDSEFFIDLDVIDDMKLEKIEDIVNFHCSQSHESSEPPRSIHSPSKKFSKKNKSQDRRPSGKVPRHRSQKEHRQKLKEKRSGLFVKEERLAVSLTAMEEDIDVLG